MSQAKSAEPLATIMKLIHNHEVSKLPGHTQRRRELMEAYNVPGLYGVCRDRSRPTRSGSRYSSPMRLKRCYSSRAALFEPHAPPGEPHFVSPPSPMPGYLTRHDVHHGSLPYLPSGTPSPLSPAPEPFSPDIWTNTLAAPRERLLLRLGRSPSQVDLWPTTPPRVTRLSCFGERLES